MSCNLVFGSTCQVTKHIFCKVQLNTRTPVSHPTTKDAVLEKCSCYLLFVDGFLANYMV